MPKGSSGMVPFQYGSNKSGRIGSSTHAQSIFREHIKHEIRDQAKWMESNTGNESPLPYNLPGDSFRNPYHDALRVSSPRLADGSVNKFKPAPVQIKLRRRVKVPDTARGTSGRVMEVEELQTFDWEPHAVGAATVLNVREIARNVRTPVYHSRSATPVDTMSVHSEGPPRSMYSSHFSNDQNQRIQRNTTSARHRQMLRNQSDSQMRQQEEIRRNSPFSTPRASPMPHNRSDRSNRQPTSNRRPIRSASSRGFYRDTHSGTPQQKRRGGSSRHKASPSPSYMRPTSASSNRARGIRQSLTPYSTVSSLEYQ